MRKSKIDFIADLLKSEKLETSHKERFFALAVEEFKKTDHDDSDIRKEIENLKQLLLSTLTQDEDTSSDGTEPMEKNLSERKHSPKDVADFMTLFNKRDGLKYLTHDFDEKGPFEIAQFLKKSNRTFKHNVFDLYSIPKSLFSVIRQFAFESKPKWKSSQDKNISTGWSTYEWLEWSSQTKLHPIRNEQFKRVIDTFRQLIRIESPNLDGIIRIVIDKAFGSSNQLFNFQMEALSKADFYTHIPSFEKALFCIFDLMKARVNHKEIIIKYNRSTEGDYFVRQLEFCQLNSYPTKELDVLLSEWNSEKGAMGAIRHNLYGYCHWSIETRIEDKPVRVNILKDDHTPPVEDIPSTNVNGFKHILTFYYR
jgi:hypothetical protein